VNVRRGQPIPARPGPPGAGWDLRGRAPPARACIAALTLRAARRARCLLRQPGRTGGL